MRALERPPRRLLLPLQEYGEKDQHLDGDVQPRVIHCEAVGLGGQNEGGLLLVHIAADGELGPKRRVVRSPFLFYSAAGMRGRKRAVGTVDPAAAGEAAVRRSSSVFARRIAIAGGALLGPARTAHKQQLVERR